jgi:uncharacterized protein with von Willebrand factor type A (vWA) domain
MIDVQTMSALLSMMESNMVNDMINNILASPQLVQFFHDHPSFVKDVEQHVRQWGQTLPTQMQNVPVPESLEQQYYLYVETQKLSNDQFRQQSSRLVIQLQSTSFYDEALALLVSMRQGNSTNQKQMFLKKWHEHLVGEVFALELDYVAQERERMMQELEQRMELAGELDDTLAPQHPGRLWDLSATHLLHGNRALFQHYTQFLQHNPELRHIAEQLGRAAQLDSHTREHLVPVEITQLKHTLSQQVPDDLTGIHLSNEINRLVSSETVLLTDPELETVFYKQFLERRLLNYEFTGEHRQQDRVIEHQFSHSQEIDEKGPFIVCIDTSGSMSGYPEDCAKGFCLALLNIAISENRPCVIMLFSTDVVTYELTDADGLQECLNFLSSSFKGGTDLEPCIKQVVEYMHETRFENADAVILSDFIAQRLSDEVQAAILQSKLKGNRFNAVCLSRHGKPALMRIFDQMWQFDTTLTGRVLRKIR